MSQKDAKLSQPQHTMKIEKDVRIPMRDGATLLADIFRPAESGHFPAIINISAYQKDKVWVPPDDLEEKANPHMTWETVNPTWWVAARLRVRARGHARLRQIAGTLRSRGLSGNARLLRFDRMDREAEWCSGNIGTRGISYHATTQWKVRETASRLR